MGGIPDRAPVAASTPSDSLRSFADDHDRHQSHTPKIPAMAKVGGAPLARRRREASRAAVGTDNLSKSGVSWSIE